MNLPASGLSGDPGPTGARGRPLVALVATLAAVCCLAVAIGAGTAAHAELARKPTPAEMSAAAAAAVADRWRSWPTGRIFPAVLGYTTQLLTQEAARRVGIAPQSPCPAGLDAPLRRLPAPGGLQRGLRGAHL